MPNRSNKNLAKKKDNYNSKRSYAQLVEAQSPEPQELELGLGPSTGEELTTTTIQAASSSIECEGRAAAIRTKLNDDKHETTSLAQNCRFQPSDPSLATPLAAPTLAEDDADEGASMLPEEQTELYHEPPQSGLLENSESHHHSPQQPNGSNKQSRKVSQSNSQVSTCFISHSNSSDSRRSSSIGGGSVSVFYNVNGASSSRQQDKLPIVYSQQQSNLKRTISSSMLEMDKSLRMVKFEVSWNDLSFSYTPSWFNTKRPTQVLRNISGRIKSNQLVAIIGPSGCGKTTLLQFLAGNNASNRNKMRILGLDEPKVAFIGQDDGLLPGLTARETLIYASRLQNNDPYFNHEEHILPILSELGLMECANRSVTKLSGGQIKRVTIAQELLYPTNLLILDEVTSGLDASTSYSIVKLLKHLVSDTNYPMSIVISIHQPSAKLFSVFDRVYVMANGSCLYEGGCQVDLINAYLGHFNLECPKFNNMADYLIEVATNDDLSSDKTVREQMIQYQRKSSQMKWEQHPLQDINDDGDMKKESGCTKSEKDPHDLSIHMVQTEQQDFRAIPLDSSLYDAIFRARNARIRPFYKHFCVHLSRSFLRIRRSYILTYLQLITYILLGLQLSTFYGPAIGILSGCPKLPSSLLSLVLSNGSDDQDLTAEMRRIQENMNFLLVAVMTATFAALEITVITFPMEAKTVKREWRNGWYRVSSYFMGRTIADLPFQLAFVVVFCVVVYAMTGQIGLSTWRFGSFVGVMVMIALVAQSVGFTFGAIFMNNLPAAVFTAPLCIFPALLFSGFFSRVSQIPQFYLPMTYLSHFRYAFDALLVTLYGYDRCQCDQQTLTSYHANLQNQTSTVKDMFKYLFGSAECDSVKSEDSIEDTVTSSSEVVASTVAMNGSLFNATTTAIPLATTAITGAKFKTIEDVLVDSVFDQMNKTSVAPVEEQPMGAMDHVAHKFSARITSMLNRQSNYGHEVPESCDAFNSYLMTEFGLRDEDLFHGLVALFIIVIVTRVVCNVILNFTIARRAT